MSTAYIQTHTETVDGGDIFAVAACEKYTLSAGGDGIVTLWDNETKEHQQLAHNKSGAHHLAADDNYLCAVYFDGSVEVWATDTLEKVEFTPPSAVWGCALSSEKRALALTTISATVHVIDLDRGVDIITIKGAPQAVATCIDITTDGNFVAVGLDSGKVSIHSTETGNLAYTLPLHTMSPRSVKFSPMGSLVAIAGNVDSISLYSLNGGDLIGTLTGHSSWLFGLSWSETGEFLLSVGHDSTAKIWSLESRSCVTTLNDSTGPLFAGAFFNKGWAPALIGGSHKGVVTAGVDHTLRWYREAAGA